MSRKQINQNDVHPAHSDQPEHLPSLISFHCLHDWVHSEDWSDWVDTHVDLILPWELSHFVGFVMHWLSYGKNHSNQQADYLRTYSHSGSVTRASSLCLGGCGFDPWPSHTKDFQNGISCSFVCTQHWESGTGRSGVRVMWLGGMLRHVSRCDMSVRQHS